MTTPAAGLLLAAGAGRRMGRPKALVTTADGRPWVRCAVEVLREGGCDPILITTGAQAPEVEALVPDRRSVRVPDWEEGMGASLRAGLGALTDLEVDRVLVHLVDLVDVGADVVARLLSEVGGGPDVLARCAYDGVPGHPVLLGRAHWAGVIREARGDRGARTYLKAHAPRLVECGDLATGRDVDRREDLP